MRQFLRPPVFESEALTQRARIFHHVTWLTMTIATGLLLTLVATDIVLLGRALASMAIIDLAGLALLEVNRRGRTRVASFVLVAVLITLVSMNSLAAGGIRSPGVAMYHVFVLMAGLLLGFRAGVITACVCALLALGLVVLEGAEALPAAAVQYSAAARWLLICLYMGVVLVLMRLATRAVDSALDRAGAELADRRSAEKDRERLVLDLRERVKELGLLHRVARLLRHDRPFDRSLLEELVAMLPPAWLHPETCEAHITLCGIDVSTPGWRETPWRQSLSFSTSKGTGAIEVAYLEERPPEVEGPFLAEERNLLASLAEMLVAYFEHQQAETLRVALENQLRHAQKMDALGTLAGGIAHDFNNILTAIGMNAQLSLDEVSHDHPQRQSFADIHTAYERATDLVRQILLFSRRQEAQRQVFQLAPVVAETLQLLRASLPATIDIRARYAPELPNVNADRGQMHQVVMNLGTNAGHAMGDRGGVLSVDLERVVLDDATRGHATEIPPGVYLCLTVGDTGSGMSPEILPRLFEPFFSTKGQGGTGLGLAVVHGIVRDQLGAIVVESELGRGSTFRVFIPAASQEASEELFSESLPPRGTGEHVMYVDDEEAIVFVMKRALERLGYKCSGFTDPAAALQAFRTNPRSFDVVITDMTMPSMSGLRLVQAMRAIHADVRVALASGFGDDAESARDAGITVRIIKPPTFYELGAAMRTLLDPRHAAPAT